MSPLPSESAATPATLPAWLRHQAQRHATAVALRYKQLGVWQEYSWQRLHDEVARLALALAERGFHRGATLTVLSHSRPEPLLLALAAQWLGGRAVLLDPTTPGHELYPLLRAQQTSFVFAESAAELAQLTAAGVVPQCLLYAEGRGLHDAAHNVHYAQVIASGQSVSAAPTPSAQPQHVAFSFYRLDTQGVIEQQQITHSELLHAGAALIAAEQLSASEEAFAARAFAAGGQARYLLAPWLMAGFRLNFPENLATRDNDRRELGPTLVAGTRDTYRRVEHLVYELLPEPGTWQRRLVDWALTPTAHWLRRGLGYWLVRRPLRDVIGFTRTRAPLLVGEPLSEPSARFYASLGIQVRTWPDPALWRPELATPAQDVDGWVASALPAISLSGVPV